MKGRLIVLGVMGGPEEPHPPREHPPASPALQELEREVKEILEGLPEASRPSLPPPTTPAVARAQEIWNFSPPPPPAADPYVSNERMLREEIVRLRWALDHIRAQIAENRPVAAPPKEAPRAPERPPEPTSAPAVPEEAPPADEISVGLASSAPRTLSAAPVFFLGADGETVATQAFFTLGKGGGLEGFLRDMLDHWRRSGFPLESDVGSEGITLRLRGDPEGRHLKVLPSGMYVLKLSISELHRLGSLPALVSSREWSKSGGFSARP